MEFSVSVCGVLGGNNYSRAEHTVCVMEGLEQNLSPVVSCPQSIIRGTDIKSLLPSATFSLKAKSSN